MVTLTRQYAIAKARASHFCEANRLAALWPGQAALDIVCMYTDVYERGLSVEEQARRRTLRAEWLRIVHASPLDGHQFGYR